MDQQTLELSSKSIETPVGPLRLLVSPSGLVAILWHGEDGRRIGLREPVADRPDPLIDAAEADLRRYFARETRRFAVPLDLRGTAFQLRVWRALLDIPYGETRTYGELAHTLGSPMSGRAVGAANGRNPVSIVVPCHRLVAATGHLTGFAGGLATKRRLLDFEAGGLLTPPASDHAVSPGCERR